MIRKGDVVRLRVSGERGLALADETPAGVARVAFPDASPVRALEACGAAFDVVRGASLASVGAADAILHSIAAAAALGSDP